MARLPWHDARSVPCRHRKVNSPSSMATIRVKDTEIRSLTNEPKYIPPGLRGPGRIMSVRNGHHQRSFDVAAPSGNEFVIKIRQTVTNPANFSVILGYKMPGTYSVFRLRRYNGKHTHTNHLEGERFHNFHIHIATERYQKAGWDEELYAQESTLHYDLNSAVECLLNDCGFIKPTANDLPLFRNQP